MNLSKDKSGQRLNRLAEPLTTGILVVMLVAICTVVGVLLQQARNAEMGRASVEASNLSSAIAQDLARNIELCDISLRQVADTLADPLLANQSPEVRHLILMDHAATAPYLGAILIADAKGTLLMSSTRLAIPANDLSQRDYFKRHHRQVSDALVISPPFVTSYSHKLAIGLSRTVKSKDGSFGGVVVGTLLTSSIERLFARIILEPGATLSLTMEDGTEIMHFPGKPVGLKPLGLAAPVAFHDEQAGEYQARTVSDGIDRLHHFQHVGPFPLVVNVGLSLEGIYGDWWRKAATMSLVLGTCCAIIVVLATQLHRELRLRTEAEVALTRLACEDAVTGIANRRHFDHVLDEGWSKALAGHQTVSLLMVDVDHFKAFNDTFGHLKGDEVLAEVAACLKATLRPGHDFCARFGGEEFVALLPATAISDACVMAEAIRDAVEARAITHPTSSWHTVSVSIGVAALVPSPGTHATELVSLADASLYRAKHAGRNCVIRHDAILLDRAAA